MLQTMLDIVVEAVAGLWAGWLVYRLLWGKKPPARTAVVSELFQLFATLAVTRRFADDVASQAIWLLCAGITAIAVGTTVVAWPGLTWRKNRPALVAVDILLIGLCLGVGVAVL